MSIDVHPLDAGGSRREADLGLPGRGSVVYDGRRYATWNEVVALLVDRCERAEDHGPGPYLRAELATAFRAWVHQSPLSKCGPGVDECPDWDLAYELADIAVQVADKHT